MTEKRTEDTPGKIDVAYVASLARLELTEAEIEAFQGQLEDVVDYVRQIGELDLDGIEPTSHACRIQNVFRKDEARIGLDREKVLGNAPAVQQDQFLVPKIIE